LAKTSERVGKVRRPGNQENASRNFQAGPTWLKLTAKRSTETEKTWDADQATSIMPSLIPEEARFTSEADTARPQMPRRPDPIMARRTSLRTVKLGSKTNRAPGCDAGGREF